MPRKSWLLHHGRPAIEIYLTDPFTGFSEQRILLADTGAGARFSPVEIILSQADVARFGVESDVGRVGMSGAIEGEFSIHAVDIEIPALKIARPFDVAGVSPAVFFPGFEGVACFRFLNTLNYGNGGNPAEFALETL